MTNSIIYCWEFGAGLGHVSKLTSMAQKFAHFGKKAILVNPQGIRFKDQKIFDEIIEFPNPNQLATTSRPLGQSITSYNAAIQGFGYSDPKFIFTGIKLWQKLFEVETPSIIIGDYAPTAMLTARAMGIPTVAFGNGYTLPPTNIEQYPRFVDQVDPVNPEILLANVNQALDLCGFSKLSYLPEIFASDIHACFTHSELDPFKKIRNPIALGPFFANAPPKANPNRPNRAFMYLTNCTKSVHQTMLGAAARLQTPVDIYSLQATPEDEKLLSGSNANLLDGPLSLQTICENYRFVAHLGGHGLTCEMLYAGMPQMLFPIDIEKILFSQAMANNGWAGQLRIDNGKSVEAVAKKFNEVLADDDIPRKLADFTESLRANQWREGLDSFESQIASLL
ncbi:MAG: hypothetical protein WBD01_04145 [Salaquimonas sp.]